MARTAAIFPTVRSEGGLLPPGVLQRIVGADRELGGFEPADYGLPERTPVKEVISRDWNRVLAFWSAFRAATDDLPPSATGVTETRDQWVLPLLRAMGYALEFRAAAEEVAGQRYRIQHRDGSVPIHITG